MAKRMLVDATHAEETRVAVVDGSRLEEFDYESIFRKQLKGNIYLAKVTRVEPSLQAAFVNFGGNRHGFLPFSEIHPDYFRIPVSDREALKEAEEEAYKAAQEAELAADEEENDDLNEEDVIVENADNSDVDSEVSVEVDNAETEAVSEAVDGETSETVDEEANTQGEIVSESAESSGDEGSEDDSENGEDKGSDEDDRRGRGNGRGRGRGQGQGRGRGKGRGRRMNSRNKGDSVEEGGRRFRSSVRHKYKIQEVIKRGQIMLIQISKEERGNKGAAVTSYLSLPGRYCVLMPNSPRAGGVSRKIANFKDRKRMREMLSDLEVPKEMSTIVRTAGVTRTKQEIKRDLDYLLRLWGNIRDLTMQSTAPAAVYQESDLAKRAIRDIYTRDVEEVLVAGEDGYKEAKNFMKLLIPSHAKKVKLYQDEKIPLFSRYQVENQISEMGETTAQMKSGGYLVINPTEALVSVDVNSGRATKERHIEETALKTNLEACDEVARQLKLRDLGGLIVIDFIDMEDRRNNYKVEKRLKEALSSDRARIQVGRISQFGLMEMSRQRLNPSLAEAQFETCKHCKGSGIVRSVDSAAIIVLRALEDEGVRGRADEVVVEVPNKIALYIFNYKRDLLAEIENRYGFKVLIRVNDDLSVSEYSLEPVKGQNSDTKDDKVESTVDVTPTVSDDDEDERSKKNSRRRGRRGGRKRRRDEEDQDNSVESTSSEDVADEASPQDKTVEVAEEVKEEKPKRARRGRKPKAKEDVEEAVAGNEAQDEKVSSEEVKDEPKEEKPKRRGRKPKKKEEPVNEEAPSDEVKEEKPKRGRRKKGAVEVKEEAVVEVSNDSQPSTPAPEENIAAKEAEKVNEAPKEKKRGWWSLK